MHRFLYPLSIVAIGLFFLFLSTPTHAQIDLDLLLNTPTPTPLPPGQEYILELEQLDYSTASDSGQFGSFSSSERKLFEEQGYVVKSSAQDISFSVDRTQIAFGSFVTAPVQEESSATSITSQESGFQILMGAKGGFASANSSIIPPTRCDSRQTCSPLRAQQWKNDQTPGWGYSLSGNDAPRDFKDKTFYRPVSLDGSIALIKQGASTKRNAPTLHWKVVTNGENEETYSTVVTLFALPY